MPKESNAKELALSYKKQGLVSKFRTPVFSISLNDVQHELGVGSVGYTERAPHISWNALFATLLSMWRRFTL